MPNKLTGGKGLFGALTTSGNVVVGGTLAVTGATTFSGAITPPSQVLSADGAITIKQGVVVITKASACAATIADPTATTDDFKTLTIISATAQAHTVTYATTGFNAGGSGTDVGTFGGAKGDGLVIVAYQGVWYIQSKTNVTLA